MEKGDNLLEQIESEMKNEIRFTLVQERRNNHNLKIAFIISDDYKMKNESVIALKRDDTGVTLISVQKQNNLNDENLKKVIQYGVTRALGLKLKGDIEKLSGPQKEFIGIHDTNVIPS
eukprot:TRINITY_DN6915_c0_g1_i3.p3 TRINITY_DN6915_c0_g1~~TRINITY_DN6915_c0_g1_i3.p3  ORF type:complete len:118 (-),score=24.65 TRINITY_DN6915_c0_g1_i3:474-827(-)